jgi:uncharacterized membrane protein
MIETHVANELIRNDLASSDGFRILTQVNGLVAPGFLLATGFILQLRPPRHALEYRSRLRRFMLWIILATAMHSPTWDNAHSQIDFSPLLHFDILHCLALSGAILLAMQWLSRKSLYPEGSSTFQPGLTGDRLLWLLTGGTLYFVFAAPFITMIAPAIPASIAGIFAHTDNSRFPLFPWAGFLLFGALLCRFNSELTRTVASEQPKTPFVDGSNVVFVGSALLAILSFALLSFGAFTQWTPDPRTDPAFFFARAGCLAAILMGLLKIQFGEARRWLMPLEWLGKRSLPIYVIHLVLLFSILPFGESIVMRIGHTLDQASISLVTLALLSVTAMLVASWQLIKGMR